MLPWQTRTLVSRPSRIPPNVLDLCPKKHEHGPCNICDRLKAINTKLDDTSWMYRNLLVQRERLVSALNQEHDLIAVKLPDELLSEIFIYACLSPYPMYPSEYFGHLFRKDILALCQTSRHWRNVAVATPRLWVHMEFIVTSSNGLHTISFAESWLKRSKSLPIHVTLTFHAPLGNSSIDRDSDVFTFCAKKILGQVASHSARLSMFHLNGPAEILALCPTSPFPNLRSLHLDLLYDPDLPSYVEPQFSCPLKTFAISFDNLTSFIGVALSFVDVFELLRKAAHLTSLMVYELHHNAEHLAKGQTLNHSSLQTIEVRNRCAVPLVLLDHLTLCDRITLRERRLPGRVRNSFATSQIP